MAKLKHFFSYARKDTEFVLKLATELRTVGVDLWLDQLDILGGQHWDRAVEDALESCEGMIAVLSPESLASNNVMDEVSYALEQRKLVVPIMLRPCDIPFRLRRVQYVDFSTDYDLGFRQLLRALRIEQQSVVAAPQVVEQRVAQEFREQPPKPAAPSSMRPRPEPAQPQSTPELQSPTSATHRLRPRWYVPLLIIVAGVVVWLLGITFHVGGGLIHLVLVISVMVLIFILVAKRGARSGAETGASPGSAVPATGAVPLSHRKFSILYGILSGALAGAIWGWLATSIFDPYFKLDNYLVNMAIVGVAGAISGSLSRMRWRVVVAAIAGSLIGWGLLFPNRGMTIAAISGTSFGAVLGSLAGVLVERAKLWK